jgi:hypothetical protein
MRAKTAGKLKLIAVQAVGTGCSEEKRANRGQSKAQSKAGSIIPVPWTARFLPPFPSFPKDYDPVRTHGTRS